MEEISSFLRRKNFAVETENIISSGMGLEQDEKINKLVNGKKCYAAGYLGSLSYLEKAGGIIVDNINDAEAVVLLSSFLKENDNFFNKIIKFIKDNKEVPVVCTNPDIYVNSAKGLFPVVGYYAQKIEQQCGIKIKWFGKPFRNYSLMLKKIIEQQLKISLNENTIFFDDNPENVAAMIDHIGIKGCVVRNSGLSSLSQFNKKVSSAFDISTFSFCE